jgi:predicted alpha/beta-hydrolase family hydrolase
MNFLTNGSGDAQYLFAHGAGAAMDSSWMSDVAELIAAHGVEVVRFEFPYMAARRDGKRRPPDREATLLQTWRDAINSRRDARPLFIGGKSMGGRMATMIADEANVTGVICFGYPFHPPGKPDSLRVAHLQTLKTPTLILQGTRDALGARAEVSTYELSSAVRVHWLEDGDHSLKPRAASGSTLAANLKTATGEAARFMKRR